MFGTPLYSFSTIAAIAAFRALLEERTGNQPEQAKAESPLNLSVLSQNTVISIDSKKLESESD